MNVVTKEDGLASAPLPPSNVRSATIDANEAVARVSYKTNEICIIYPITPASAMGEHADALGQQRRDQYLGCRSRRRADAERSRRGRLRARIAADRRVNNRPIQPPRDYC